MDDQPQNLSFSTPPQLYDIDRECIDDTKELRQPILVISPIFLVITIALLTLMVFLTIKVGRLVWENDKLVPIMLACLCSSLLSLVLYYSFQIVEVSELQWTCGNDTSFLCVQNTILYLPSFFLANAVLLNINKWIYFTLKIFASIRVGFGVRQRQLQNYASQQMPDDSTSNSSTSTGFSAQLELYETVNKDMRRKQKYVNILTVICVSCYSIPQSYYLVKRCVSGEDPSLQSLTDFAVIIMFACLGVAFLACGITMNIAFKQYFPHFYETYRCMLWLATFSLSVPLLLRAVINLAYRESTTFNRFFEKEFVIANNTFLIFSTYLPIFTSMFSLIFGYLRKRQEAMTSSEESGAFKPTIHGGSGELGGNMFDEKASLSTSSAMQSDLNSYLDPPIENYKFVYSGRLKSPNASKLDPSSPQNSNSNNYLVKKIHIKKQVPGGIGGTDSLENSRVKNRVLTQSDAFKNRQSEGEVLTSNMPVIPINIKQNLQLANARTFSAQHNLQMRRDILKKFGSQSSQEGFLSSKTSDPRYSKETFNMQAQSRKRGNQTMSGEHGIFASSPDGAETLLNSSQDNRFDYNDLFQD